MANNTSERLAPQDTPLHGRVFVGHRAPAFGGDAVVNGVFEDISLDQYIKRGQWVCLIFIPAAFSIVCPTEVLAFDNCIDEFTERNCAMVFVSTDSKHSLWHWQNLPRKMGGLGRVQVPLLSDQSHKISRDYGVLLEKSGIDLRGTFIIDPEGIVQQITINNLSVGRSVLEALRLVEAFQAAKEKGALCPANWKGGEDTMEETNEEDEQLLLGSFEKQLQVKNLDDNSVQPFHLVMPDAGHKRQTSAPAVGAGAHGITSKRNSTSSAMANKRSSFQPREIQGIVTLDFADPLSAMIGTDGSIPGSPHEFVGMDFASLRGNKGGSEHATSPSAGSISSLKKTTVDALKRVSGNWSTPLSSPLAESALNRNGLVATGYFD